MDYIKVVYDDTSHPHTAYPGKLAAYLLQSFGLEPGMKLLEPGCGRGEFLSEFQQLGLECYGLDRSSGAQQYITEIPFAECDVESQQLPYEDDTFDVIYNKSFLEHLRDPERFLSEGRRVLKPGGRMLCLVPDWEANYKIYFDDHTHHTPFSRVSLRDILRICDFDEIQVFRFRQLPIVWKYPQLNYLCAAISPFIPVRTKNKFLRWSRELMLIGSCRKPIE